MAENQPILGFSEFSKSFDIVCICLLSLQRPATCEIYLNDDDNLVK